MVARKLIPDIFKLSPPSEAEYEAGILTVPACILCGERLPGIRLGDFTNNSRAQQLLHWTETHKES